MWYRIDKLLDILLILRFGSDLSTEIRLACEDDRSSSALDRVQLHSHFFSPCEKGDADAQTDSKRRRIC